MDLEAPSSTTTPGLCSEQEIPVPWGHISVKCWNDPCGWPVLAVHGIQDNAGSFDRLIPLLPNSFYFVAVDLPGHGHSSHFPPGVPLNFLDYVTAIKRIVVHLRWTKFHYMGHSLGGQIGAFYTALFPETVSKLIMLDAITTTPIMPSHSILTRQRMLYDNLIDLETKLATRQAPVYSFEEALSRLVENRSSKLSTDAAQALIVRSLLVTPDGYRFRTDQRLKNGLRPFMYVEQHLEVVEKIVCPHLIILAQETVGLFQMEDFKTVVDAYKAKGNVTYQLVEGNHDVHNNNPERIAPIITNFLYSLKSTL